MGIRYRHHGVYITEESFKALSADYTRLAEAGPPPTIGYPRYSELREVVEVIRQIRFPPEMISGIEDYSTAAWRDGHQEAVRAHSEVLWQRLPLQSASLVVEAPPSVNPSTFRTAYVALVFSRASPPTQRGVVPPRKKRNTLFLTGRCLGPCMILCATVVGMINAKPFKQFV